MAAPECRTAEPRDASAGRETAGSDPCARRYAHIPRPRTYQEYLRYRQGAGAGSVGDGTRFRSHPFLLDVDAGDGRDDRSIRERSCVELDGAPMGHLRAQRVRREGTNRVVHSDHFGARHGRSAEANAVAQWPHSSASPRDRRAGRRGCVAGCERRVSARLSGGARPGEGTRGSLCGVALLRSLGVPVRCTLCGDGPLRAELEASVAQLGLQDAVEFAGFVPHDTLHEWYRDGRFAAMVLASRDDGELAMEGIPSALVEAMAFGLPVVATDSGSIGELIDSQCGLLVKSGDTAELASALLNVLQDPVAAQTRARRAYDLVASEHDVRTQMEKLATALVRKEVRG